MPTTPYDTAKAINQNLIEAKDHIQEISKLFETIEYSNNMMKTALNRVEGGLENYDKLIADFTRDYEALTKLVEQNKAALSNPNPTDKQDDALLDAETSVMDYESKLEDFREMLSGVAEALSINRDILWGFMHDVGSHHGDVLGEFSSATDAVEKAGRI